MKFEFKNKFGLVIIASTEVDNDNYFLEEEKGLEKTVRFIVYIESNDGKNHKQEIGHFYFSPMPGCCGVVVSHQTFVNKDFRSSEASKAFRDLKTALARKLGYSCMIATTRMEDIPAVKNMFKSGYNISATFINKRTNNLLGFGIKKL